MIKGNWLCPLSLIIVKQAANQPDSKLARTDTKSSVEL